MLLVKNLCLLKDVTSAQTENCVKVGVTIKTKVRITLKEKILVQHFMRINLDVDEGSEWISVNVGSVLFYLRNKYLKYNFL